MWYLVAHWHEETFHLPVVSQYKIEDFGRSCFQFRALTIFPWSICCRELIMYMLWRISMVKPPPYRSLSVDVKCSGPLAHRGWTFTRRAVTPLSTSRGIPAASILAGIRRHPKAKGIKGWIADIFGNSRPVCRCHGHDSFRETGGVIGVRRGDWFRQGAGGRSDGTCDSNIAPEVRAERPVRSPR